MGCRCKIDYFALQMQAAAPHALQDRTLLRQVMCMVGKIRPYSSSLRCTVRALARQRLVSTHEFMLL